MVRLINALMRLDFRAAERIEFGKLNNPDTLGLQHGVFAAQVRQFVGEIRPRERLQCGGFLVCSLRAFEDRAAIGL